MIDKLLQQAITLKMNVWYAVVQRAIELELENEELKLDKEKLIKKLAKSDEGNTSKPN